MSSRLTPLTAHDNQLEHLALVLKELKKRANSKTSDNQHDVGLLNNSIKCGEHFEKLGKTLKTYAVDESGKLVTLGETPMRIASDLFSSVSVINIPFKILADILAACNDAKRVDAAISSLLNRLTGLAERLYTVVEQNAANGGSDLQADDTFRTLKDQIITDIHEIQTIDKNRTSWCNACFNCTKARKAKAQLKEIEAIERDLDRTTQDLTAVDILALKHSLQSIVRVPEMENLLNKQSEELNKQNNARNEDLKELIAGRSEECKKHSNAPSEDCKECVERVVTSTNKIRNKIRNFTVPPFFEDEYVPVRKDTTLKVCKELKTIDRSCIVLKGSAGTGKSWLIRGIATRSNIAAYFSQRILWIRIDQDLTSEKLLALLSEVHNHIKPKGSPTAQFKDKVVAVNAINKIIGEEKYLFLLDDVWHTWILESFLHIKVSFLVTTRMELMDLSMRKETTQIELEPALDVAEAVSLLQVCSGISSNEETKEVAKLLGYLAFTLGLASKIVCGPEYNKSSYNKRWRELKLALQDGSAMIGMSKGYAMTEEMREETAFQMLGISSFLWYILGLFVCVHR